MLLINKMKTVGFNKLKVVEQKAYNPGTVADDAGSHAGGDGGGRHRAGPVTQES